jgi:hypothetical protein
MRSISESDGTLIHIQVLESQDVLWRAGEEISPGEGFRFAGSLLGNLLVLMISLEEQVLYYGGRELLRAQRIEAEVSWGAVLIKTTSEDGMRIGILPSHDDHRARLDARMCPLVFVHVHQLICDPDRNYRHVYALATRIDGSQIAVYSLYSQDTWNASILVHPISVISGDGKCLIANGDTPGIYRMERSDQGQTMTPVYQGQRPIRHVHEFRISRAASWHLFTEVVEDGSTRAILLHSRNKLATSQPFDELVSVCNGTNERGEIVGTLCVVKRGDKTELDFIGMRGGETKTLASASALVQFKHTWNSHTLVMYDDDGQMHWGTRIFEEDRLGPSDVTWKPVDDNPNITITDTGTTVDTDNGHLLLRPEDTRLLLEGKTTNELIGPFDERQGGIVQKTYENDKPFAKLVVARVGTLWGLFTTGGMLPATHRYDRVFGARFTHDGKVLECYGIKDNQLHKLKVCAVLF